MVPTMLRTVLRTVLPTLVQRTFKDDFHFALQQTALDVVLGNGRKRLWLVVAVSTPLEHGRLAARETKGRK